VKRIVVEPPVSEARRDRVERQLFAKLATVRITDRADAVIPPARRSRSGLGLALAGFAAAAAVFLLITRDGERGGNAVASSSRVMTPVGATTKVTVPGAVLTALSGSSFEWLAGVDGSMTITLQHGAVDCQVDPRKGKPPFRVISGDVTVTVVGTRFTVTRTPNPRVDVAQGVVKVEWSGNVTQVEAGQTWTPYAISAQEEQAPEEAPAPTAPEIEMDAMQVAKPARAKRVAPAADKLVDVPAPQSPPAQADRQLEDEALRVAASLEGRDAAASAKLYRAIVTSGKANAAVALFSLADLHFNKLKDFNATLQDLDELARDFPKSANAEEAAWLRIRALTALHKRDEARGAAADYLRQFPNGTYADSAARLTK